MSVGNKSRPGCPGSTLLDPVVDLSIVAGQVVLLLFNLFMFRKSNKMVKIIRKNNLFNEQTQIFICYFQHVVFAANVGGSELQSYHACVEVVVFMFYMCSS